MFGGSVNQTGRYGTNTKKRNPGNTIHESAKVLLRTGKAKGGDERAKAEGETGEKKCQ